MTHSPTLRHTDEHVDQSVCQLVRRRGQTLCGERGDASLCDESFDGDASLCGGETHSSASRSQSMRIMSECMWCVGHDGSITAIKPRPNATFSVSVTQHYCQRGRVVTCDCCCYCLAPGFETENDAGLVCFEIVG